MHHNLLSIFDNDNNLISEYQIQDVVVVNEVQMIREMGFFVQYEGRAPSEGAFYPPHMIGIIHSRKVEE